MFHFFGFIVILLLCGLICTQSKATTNSVIGSAKGRKTLLSKTKKLSPLTEILSKSSALTSTPAVNTFQKGLMAVIGGALAHLTLGTIYCWLVVIRFQNIKSD